MVLDDLPSIARIDAGEMLSAVASTGAMLAEGWQAAGDVPVPRRPATVAVCGLGGSAIGGDLLSSLLAPSSAAPVLVVRDDHLPAYIGSDTLVFACSYSGDTEETLAAFEAARAAGAAIVAVTSGGRLAQTAAESGAPLVRLRPGLQPRAALALMLAPMLRVVSACGLSPIQPADVREAGAVLAALAAQWGPEIPTPANPAKTLAVALGDAIPAVYAASPRLGPVATRWKTQINENGKRFAVANTFPELLHNEVVGWEGVRPGGPAIHVVVLRDPDHDGRAEIQIEAARSLAFRSASGSTDVWGQGPTPLARLLSLIQFGDLVSVYLAVLSGIDPTPVDLITRIKDRVRAVPEGRMRVAVPENEMERAEE